MTSPTAEIIQLPRRCPTMWGLDPVQLHDHYWAARGVFVVRPGQRIEIPQHAELYLLTDPQTLAVFRLVRLIETMSWVRPLVMFVRLRDKRETGYREKLVTDRFGRFVQFNRIYDSATHRMARVALTADRGIARAWQMSPGSALGWRQLRRRARLGKRETAVVEGRAYSRSSEEELASLVYDLVEHWQQPAATLPVKKIAPRAWAHRDVRIDPTVKIIGAAWIGAGRRIPAGTSVLGPAALWDDPASRPIVRSVAWDDLEPTQSAAASAASAMPRNRRPSFYRITKRLFDIAVALAALAMTVPFYPLIMLAIWLDAGRPFFFVHRRESAGGRSFPLIKFRSMRKDAELIKLALKQENRADGPQFYLPNDPRITRVGRVLRRWNIDELPQIINVLLGHMSLVGPRPSPYKENQFCPTWREARLSVRPGITGLWQVMRTRRSGLDFQEWIRYDLEYVQRAGWRLDLWIIYKTFRVVLFWD